MVSEGNTVLQDRNLRFVAYLAAVIAFPTVAALAWYAWSQDPNLRPLGITIQNIRQFYGGGSDVEIVAVIDWPEGEGRTAALERLVETLRMSFYVKGVDVMFDIHETPGQPLITYVIGESVLGPVPVGRAGESVGAAVEALRMYGTGE